VAEQSEQINELVKALVEVQRTMAPVIKGKSNPFFKSKYADLANIWDALREPLADNGLAVMQTADVAEPGFTQTEETKGERNSTQQMVVRTKTGAVTIVTTLAHTSGQWIRGSLCLPLAKADPQGVGSAITYGRRYTLAAMLGVAPEDDDGEAAVGRGKAPAKHETPPPAPTPPEPPKQVAKATTGGREMVSTSGEYILKQDGPSHVTHLSAAQFNYLSALGASLLNMAVGDVKKELTESTVSRETGKTLLDLCAPQKDKDKPAVPTEEKLEAWRQETGLLPVEKVTAPQYDGPPPHSDDDIPF